MRKSLALIGTLLLGISLCSCTKSGKEEREYPEIAPIFECSFASAEYAMSDPLETQYDHLTVGNSYSYLIKVANRFESYAYSDDISFSYEKNAFDVHFFFATFEPKAIFFRYVIDVKALPSDRQIKISHLNETINIIDLPVVESDRTLAYHRLDNTRVDGEFESLTPLSGKATLVTSKQQYDETAPLGSTFLRGQVNEKFFNTRAIVYIVAKWGKDMHAYEGYYTEGDTIYFRVGNYYSVPSNDPIYEWQVRYTMYTVVIDKADADAINECKIFYSFHIKE